MHWPVQGQRQGWILAVWEALVARPGALWPGLVQIHCCYLGSAKFLSWAQEPVEWCAGFEGQQCHHLTPSPVQHRLENSTSALSSPAPAAFQKVTQSNSGEEGRLRFHHSLRPGRQRLSLNIRQIKLQPK